MVSCKHRGTDGQLQAQGHMCSCTGALTVSMGSTCVERNARDHDSVISLTIQPIWNFPGMSSLQFGKESFTRLPGGGGAAVEGGSCFKVEISMYARLA
jgi:hypothetical protein